MNAAQTDATTARSSGSSACSSSRCSASATRSCRSTRRSARPRASATSRSADAVVNTQVDATRDVRIEFDSNIRKLPWTFRALSPVVDVHPGEVRQVVFEIVNTTDRAADGPGDPELRTAECRAVFPEARVLLLHEADAAARARRRQMPVVFVVDAALPADVATITLSYTFFEVEGADKSNDQIAGALIRAAFAGQRGIRDERSRHRRQAVLLRTAAFVLAARRLRRAVAARAWARRSG